MDSAELMSISFISILQRLDSLAECFAYNVVLAGGVDACVGVLPAKRACGHRRQQSGRNPIHKLKKGVIVAVSEKRQFRHISVSCSVNAEIPRE